MVVFYRFVIFGGFVKAGTIESAIAFQSSRLENGELCDFAFFPGHMLGVTLLHSMRSFSVCGSEYYNMHLSRAKACDPTWYPT